MRRLPPAPSQAGTHALRADRGRRPRLRCRTDQPRQGLVRVPARGLSEEISQIQIVAAAHGGKTMSDKKRYVDFGYPRTIQELQAALDLADEERNDPSKWVSSIEFHQRLEEKYPWLR